MLEKFRLQWKKELTKLNSNSKSETTTASETPDKFSSSITTAYDVDVTSANDALPPNSGLDIRTHCDHCGKLLPQPQPQRQRVGNKTARTENDIIPELNVHTSDQGYFPFVILDKFLKYGNHTHRSVVKNTNLNKKRKYFDEEESVMPDGSKGTKRQQDDTTCLCSKLVTSDKKRETGLNRTKERYLDIFIADLVWLTSF